MKLLLSVPIALFLLGGGVCIQASVIPYSDPSGQGTQGFGGNLALTFDVLSPITITALGVYNSSGSGTIAGRIQVVIYNTVSNAAVTPVVTFSGAYTPQALGFDVFQLITPVVLGPGSYEVDAVGFSVADDNGNLNTGSTTGPALNNDAGQLTFTGAAYDGSPTLDEPKTCPGCQALPAQMRQFDAGTFEINGTQAPEPSTLGLLVCGFAGMTAILRRMGASKRSQRI